MSGKNNAAGWNGGVHAELNIDNMGRFIVLMDKTFTLDADDPQVTIPFQISGSQIGPVRYNGPGTNSLTDKGIYVIWAAYTAGVGRVATPEESVGLQGPNLHSRLAFTDS